MNTIVQTPPVPYQAPGIPTLPEAPDVDDLPHGRFFPHADGCSMLLSRGMSETGIAFEQRNLEKVFQATASMKINANVPFLERLGPS